MRRWNEDLAGWFGFIGLLGLVYGGAGAICGLAHLGGVLQNPPEHIGSIAHGSFIIMISGIGLIFMAAKLLEETETPAR